jgi:hypothetical protein
MLLERWWGGVVVAVLGRRGREGCESRQVDESLRVLRVCVVWGRTERPGFRACVVCMRNSWAHTRKGSVCVCVCVGMVWGQGEQL